MAASAGKQRPLVLSFLGEFFIESNHGATAASTLIGALDDHLYVIRSGDPGLYSRAPQRPRGGPWRLQGRHGFPFGSGTERVAAAAAVALLDRRYRPTPPAPRGGCPRSGDSVPLHTRMTCDNS